MNRTPNRNIYHPHAKPDIRQQANDKNRDPCIPNQTKQNINKCISILWAELIFYPCRFQLHSSLSLKKKTPFLPSWSHLSQPCLQCLQSRILYNFKHPNINQFQAADYQTRYASILSNLLSLQKPDFQTKPQNWGMRITIINDSSWTWTFFIGLPNHLIYWGSGTLNRKRNNKTLQIQLESRT